MSENIKDSLKIKSVDVRYLKQYNELMRYVFQVTKRQVEECGYEEGELVRSKRPVLKEAEVLGWFTEDDQLISSASIYPCEVNIHGKIYKMGGVTGVGTYPEYANMGLMSALLRLALEKMRDANQYISYLYPYSIPYYRNKGWEIISDRITFNLKDTQIPSYAEVGGHIERHDVRDSAITDIYNRFSKITHGALIRHHMEWEEYWRWENEEERTAAIYFDENNVPQGYIFYWIEKDVFYIKEMVYLVRDAYYALWNFVKAHFSMIEELKGYIYTSEPLAFQLEESQIEEVIEPYYMARIVDVQKFLENYPYDDEIKEFHFVVTDPIAEWNNRIFGLKKGATENSVEVVDHPVGNPVELDIQTLSTLMMSYKAPAYLHKIERLKTDPYTLRILEKIIPGEQPYFSDYF